MKYNSNNNFNGFINTNDIIAHYVLAHRDRHSSLIGPVVGLRQTTHVFSTPYKSNLYEERFVYVGCIHGGNEDIFDRLRALAENPPTFLIFMGDMTGSPEIEKYKKEFYDDKEINPGGKFAKFSYFGDWVKTWPLEKRKSLLETLSAGVSKLTEVIKKIEKKGTEILILEGNWDNPIVSGVRMIAGNDIKNVFDTREYFIRKGFNIISNIKILNTKTAIHILLPYITLLNFDFIPKRKLMEMKKEIVNAENQNKTVIMVGHAEANWKIHHLMHTVPLTVKERQTVIHNFGRAIAIFRPHEVIYPHMHSRIRDEKEYLLSLDMKYLLEIVKSHREKEEGYVRLVTDTNRIRNLDGKVIATYIPFGYMGEEEFVKLCI